jgi:hypothetical protein
MDGETSVKEAEE